jgi:hypothetical protein
MANRLEKTVHKTISIPESLAGEMDHYPEINWSGLATSTFRKRIEAEKILSRFSEPGITQEEIARRIKELEASTRDNKYKIRTKRSIRPAASTHR